MNNDRRNFVLNLPVMATSGVLAGSLLNDQASAADKQVGPAARAKKVVAGGSPNYSRTVEFNGLLYVAGVLGVDPQLRKLASPDFEGQCRQVIRNLQASIEAGGSRLAQVLKCTCFLVDAGDFETMNKVYRDFFTQDPPARSTVVVKELVMAGAKIEVDCIAHL